jgi:predicted Zn-dependent protease
VGRKDEAAELARSFPRPPATANEVRRLAETQIVLGMRDEARRFLQDNVQQSGNSPDLWMLQANLLGEDKKWEELREFALQLRQQPSVRDTLANYSFYLEGRAELGLERPAVAEAAFEKASRRPFEDTALGFTTAGSLLKLGYPAAARDILLPLETGLSKNPDYWQTLFAAAYALKQPDLMGTAAAKAYELQPDNIVTANNYAAALLVNRARAEEAVRLTLQLVARFPNSTSPKINHALALILNRRTAEAEEILTKIDPAKLGPLEATSLFLGLFEVYSSGKRYEQAREAASRIDIKYLFPNQIKWLEDARRQMPQQQAAK